MSTPTFAG